MRVDLHMHSTASDGAYTPAEVVNIAITHQMDVIALTDHDNVQGIPLAVEAAKQTQLQVIAGVELSSQDETVDRHLLGYMLNIEYAPLLAQLDVLRNGRVYRIQEMVKKLESIGLPIDPERVLQMAGDGSVGRPHLARAMLDKGYVSSIQDAFDRYIGDDGAAYVPHPQFAPDEAIRLIHEAGGVAVLAHPGHYENFAGIVEELVAQGLDGVETYYYDHSPKVVSELYWLAKHHDLVMTVGSDFHRREGDGSARIGSVRFPPEVDIVGAMQQRAERYRKPSA
jgi:predicted metal-dependent phosphoesterase TrpH